jgi:hypothetical protein
MRQSPIEPPHCPFGELLEVLARPWTMHVLWVLSTNGPTPASGGDFFAGADGAPPRSGAKGLRLPRL